MERTKQNFTTLETKTKNEYEYARLSKVKNGPYVIAFYRKTGGLPTQDVVKLTHVEKFRRRCDATARWDAIN